jgi:hypothetical protein
MRAHFVRGGEPKEIMDIGRYRSDGNPEDLFERMHREAEKSPNFESVTPIRRESKEPSFIIVSKFEKTVTRNPVVGGSIRTIRTKEQWTIYLTRDQGVVMFDDLTDDEYEDLSYKEFLRLTRCQAGVKEAQNFERGIDPKQSMGVGLRNKYGQFYDLFVLCHNLAMNSENFPWVGEIVNNGKDAPFFNIESVFFYTTEEDNEKIPEQFVINLYPDELTCYNVITKEENSFRSDKKFIQLTNCWDEPDEGWERWNYESKISIRRTEF